MLSENEQQNTSKPTKNNKQNNLEILNFHHLRTGLFVLLDIICFFLIRNCFEHLIILLSNVLVQT